MRISKGCILLALGLLAGWASSAATAGTGLSADYLVGRWSFEGSERCSAAGAEHVEFRENETFQVDRGKQVDAVGFWEVSESRIILHLVASPHRITSAHPEIAGLFDYGNLKLHTFDLEADSFTAVVASGDEVNKSKASRCR